MPHHLFRRHLPPTRTVADPEVRNLALVSDNTSADARLFIPISPQKQNRAASGPRGRKIQTIPIYRPKCEAFFV